MKICSILISLIGLSPAAHAQYVNFWDALDDVPTAHWDANAYTAVASATESHDGVDALYITSVSPYNPWAYRRNPEAGTLRFYWRRGVLNNAIHRADLRMKELSILRVASETWEKQVITFSHPGYASFVLPRSWDGAGPNDLWLDEVSFQTSGGPNLSAVLESGGTEIAALSHVDTWRTVALPGGGQALQSPVEGEGRLVLNIPALHSLTCRFAVEADAASPQDTIALQFKKGGAISASRTTAQDWETISLSNSGQTAQTAEISFQATRSNGSPSQAALLIDSLHINEPPSVSLEEALDTSIAVTGSATVGAWRGMVTAPGYDAAYWIAGEYGSSATLDIPLSGPAEVRLSVGGSAPASAYLSRSGQLVSVPISAGQVLVVNEDPGDWGLRIAVYAGYGSGGNIAILDQLRVTPIIQPETVSLAEGIDSDSLTFTEPTDWQGQRKDGEDWVASPILDSYRTPGLTAAFTTVASSTRIRYSAKFTRDNSSYYYSASLHTLTVDGRSASVLTGTEWGEFEFLVGPGQHSVHWQAYGNQPYVRLLLDNFTLEESNVMPPEAALDIPAGFAAPLLINTPYTVEADASREGGYVLRLEVPAEGVLSLGFAQNACVFVKTDAAAGDLIVGQEEFTLVQNDWVPMLITDLTFRNNSNVPISVWLDHLAPVAGGNVYEGFDLAEYVDLAGLSSVVDASQGNYAHWGTPVAARGGDFVEVSQYSDGADTFTLPMTLTGPGTLSFQWKIQTRQNPQGMLNWLELDGQYLRPLGAYHSGPWTNVSIQVPPGEHTLTLLSRQGLGNSIWLDDFRLTAAQPLATYAGYAASLGLAGPHSAELADADGDGWKNLWEYALDTNMMDNSSRPTSLLTLKHSPGQTIGLLRFAQLRADRLQGIHYHFEFSSDLATGSWSMVDQAYGQTIWINPEGIWDIALEVNTPAPRGYYRLVFSDEPPTAP